VIRCLSVSSPPVGIHESSMGVHHEPEVKLMRRGLSFAIIALVAAGCSSTTQPAAVQTDAPRPGLVGPAGPQGPAGPIGAQGATGATGAAGSVMSGPRGADGSSGPMGPQGATGATGASGAVVTGHAGVAGPVGPAGAQGPTGATGAQGASVVGAAGPTGVPGPAGSQGETGKTGPRGETLVGPSGPAGVSGVAGSTGGSGEKGAQGSTMAGIAGETGRSGPAGVQGPIGSTGAQGPVGVVDRWTSYREFVFDYNAANINTGDQGKVAEIAGYMKQNPSLQIGIDGSMDPRGNDPRDQALSDRRVGAVRDALIQAGVPASKIQTGAFGDTRLTRDRRVEVLVKTGS
jgi:hypothetical protein